MTSARGLVVVVDDGAEVRSLLIDHLEMLGYGARGFADGREALAYLMASHAEGAGADLVLTDLRMPEVDGLALLNHLKIHSANLPVIIMTAYASVDSAIEGLRKGAIDYLIKPFRLAEITFVIERAIMFGRLRRRNDTLKNELRRSWSRGSVIGRSRAMADVLALVDRVAESNSSVLIRGESGTGKEVIARAIHQQGPRAAGPFVAINCAAIPEGLLESELFGHERGSFTGAAGARTGLFVEATGGTLFLDEIGDLDVSLQAKLLRVLQEREVRPLGSNQAIPIDVRIIAATHRDLEHAMKSGTFREDLYFRLAVVPLTIPPLRQRTEDIPLLVHHFIDKYSLLNDGRVCGCSPAAMRKLLKYPWPGNVRELQNVIERMVVLSADAVLGEVDVPGDEAPSWRTLFEKSTGDLPTIDVMVDRYVDIVLKHTGHHRERAARILGINRRTLYRRERAVHRDHLAQP